MSTRVFAAACFSALLLPAAAAKDPDPVTAAEYKEATTDRDFARKTIDLTNSILGAASKYKLTPSWERSRFGPDGKSLVKVYLIRPTKPPFVLQVPFKSCNCIFLQVGAYRNNIFSYSEKFPQMSKLDERYILAFMLLHEIGHINQNDAGHIDQAKGDFNYDDNELKQRELAADRFAAQTLMKSANDKESTSGFLNSMYVQMDISKASFNLQAVRSLENFGGTALCSTYLFADRGASHPNFELRILTVNDILVHSPETSELLRTFEKCRAENPTKIIYRSE